MNNLDRINKLKRKAGINDVVMVRLFLADGSVKVVSDVEIDKAHTELMDAIRNKKPIPRLAEIIGDCMGTDYPYMTDLVRVLVRAYRKYDGGGGVTHEEPSH